MAHTQIYAGPSLFGGEVRAVVSTHTNSKVGHALGLWILPAAGDAMASWRAKTDSATCGDCPLRAAAGGGCYTHPGSARILMGAPRGAGVKLGDTMAALSRGATHLRSAVYGDIGALPPDILAHIRGIRVSQSLRPLGYTHAWRNRPDLRVDHMASVSSEGEAAEAQAAGWRTFRDRPAGAPLVAGEVQCPATAEARRTNPITCAQCNLCDGNARGGKLPSVSIWRHDRAGQLAGRKLLATLAIAGAA